MTRPHLLLPALAALGLLAAAPAAAAEPAPATPATPALPSQAELERMTARFAPVELRVDVSKLPVGEREALAHMLRAARIMDPLFMRQVWAGNEARLVSLLEDRTPLGRARLEAFLLNKGPWWRNEDNRPFLPGVGPKPHAGNFYAAGASKEQVEAWMKKLPAAAQAQARGFFTTVRRTPEGKLTAVPYSLEYQGELAEAAAHLREAARLTRQPTLKAFLEKRAQAFVSNDYYASDVAWMELDASVEPTIGPYEVYEDEWFNYKAAFEAFITLRDDAETQKLAQFSSQLQWLEDRLPIEARYRNPKLGALAPIRVVNSVFSSGDANRGVQTAAFNLPNDERVAREKGTKRVMLKNVQEAKFEKVLRPIAQRVLSAADQQALSFDAFFTHILMHELMHGLGPHTIKVGGKETTVRQALQASSSAIEEAKADISGLWALQQLVDKGALPKELERTMYVTFLASSFRTLRFGLNEAHGRGMAMQLNALLDAGAFKVAADGTFSVDTARVKQAVEAHTRELMTLQAQGDRAAAEKALSRATLRPEVQRALAKLEDIPVDIAPRFVTADEVLQAFPAPLPAAAHP